MRLGSSPNLNQPPEHGSVARAADFSTLGEELRQRRRLAGLSQEELFERSGVSVRTISNIERGVGHRPRKSTIKELARGLGLSDEELRQLEASAEGRISFGPGVQPSADLSRGASTRGATRSRVVLGLLTLLLISGIAAWRVTQAPGKEQRVPTFPDGYESAEECSRDAFTVDTQTGVAADGRPFADLQLRFSKKCGMAWGKLIRKDQDNPIPGIVHIRAARPGTLSESIYDHDGPDSGIFGNLLGNIESCVFVEAWVGDGPDASPHIRTECYRAGKGAGVSAEQ